MRAAVYCRVSTSSRSRFGVALAYDQNPEVQEAPLRRLIAARGWTLTQVYVDRVSGAKENRPALAQLLDDGHRGTFDVVVVWRFDRLSRSLRHFLALVEELRSFGVDLVSHEQAFDSTTPMGRFTLSMFGALAELEREVIQERVRAGIDYARVHGTKSGRAIGRPRVIFRRDQVAELRRQGTSWREIARQLGAGVGTVRRMYETASTDPAAACQNPLDGGL